jgi:hypothetical protein
MKMATNMNEANSLPATGAAPTPADNPHAELRNLIASSRQRLAGAVNAELTRLYWSKQLGSGLAIAHL